MALPVRVTVAVGRKTVSVDEVRDLKVAGALREAARNIGGALAQAKCPTHGKGPTDIRLHFDAGGNGDLKYESCCAELASVCSKLV